MWIKHNKETLQFNAIFGVVVNVALSFVAAFTGLLILLSSNANAESLNVASDVDYKMTSYDNPVLHPISPSLLRPISRSLPQEKLTTRTRLFTWGTALSFAIYGYNTWWKDSSSSFHFQNEGWFQHDSYAGGADKLGHGYSAYVTTRLVTRGLQWSGHTHRDAVNLSATVAALTMTGIEVMDGFTEDYGFSREDFIINMSGIGLAYLLETRPGWDRKFDMRLLYDASDDSKRFDESDPIADYSGQIYLWITKASGFERFEKHPWMQYLELAVGYGSKGYRPANPDPAAKHRNVYLGVSLNLSRLLNKSEKLSSRAQAISDGVLEYIQIPGTVVLRREEL